MERDNQKDQEDTLIPARRTKRPRTEENRGKAEEEELKQQQYHKEDDGDDDDDDDDDDQTHTRIPTFDIAMSDEPEQDQMQISSNDFLEAYQLYQVVHFKNNNKNRISADAGATTTTILPKPDENNNEKRPSTSLISWKDIGSIYEDLEETDRNSWCIENAGGQQQQQQQVLNSKTFLIPEITNHRAYCSFLVQNDKISYDKLLQRLPMKHLRFHKNNKKTIDDHHQEEEWSYEPCLWFFFGRNNNSNNNKPLEGRGLHTDSVCHDGTWHYQLSGTKTWYLTPSCDFIRHYRKQQQKLNQQHNKNKNKKKENDNDGNENCNDDNDDDNNNNNNNNNDNDDDPFMNESTQIKITCHEGDVIVINTRLWFHRTVIPYQSYPSVSYARDFRLLLQPPIKQQQSTNSNNGTIVNNNHDVSSATTTTTTTTTKTTIMTNVDGLYARNDIDAGTIIFTEKDMPDLELHRSNTNPNCEVVELDDGTNAVVSRRSIACGEFFCVAESSSEDDENEDDYDEEGEEEEGDFVDDCNDEAS